MMMYGCDMAAVTQKKLVNITMLRRAAARQREAVTSGMEELHSRRATEVLQGNVVWVCFSFFCSIQQGQQSSYWNHRNLKHFLKKKKNININVGRNKTQQETGWKRKILSQDSWTDKITISASHCVSVQPKLDWHSGKVSQDEQRTTRTILSTDPQSAPPGVHEEEGWGGCSADA